MNTVILFQKCMNEFCADFCADFVVFVVQDGHKVDRKYRLVTDKMKTEMFKKFCAFNANQKLLINV